MVVLLPLAQRRGLCSEKIIEGDVNSCGRKGLWRKTSQCPISSSDHIADTHIPFPSFLSVFPTLRAES